MKKIGIIGSGSLATIIGQGVSRDLADKYEILGVLSRNYENALKLSNKIGSRAYKSLDELIEDKPDYLIEAASPQVVRDIGEKILENSIGFIPLSLGVFADEDFYKRMEKLAIENKTRVHIPSGALGGFDVLHGACLMEEAEVSITTEKSPQSLNGAPYLQGRKLSEEEFEEVFSGSAEDAIKYFPNNVNVAVATALATRGVKATRVEINSRPGSRVNKHEINLKGKTVRVKVEVETSPSKDNPKSSSLAAYSVIALLERLAAPITF